MAKSWILLAYAKTFAGEDQLLCVLNLQIAALNFNYIYPRRTKSLVCVTQIEQST